MLSVAGSLLGLCQKNLDERLSGYREAFAAHPQIKIIEVVDIQGSGQVALDKAREILAKRKGNVDGFVCLEAVSGKEVADVLDHMHLQGKTVVAMDTDDGTLEWIRKGMIAATIAQKPYTMAYYGLKTLDELHHRKPDLQNTSLLQGPFAPLPTLVDTGATLIDKDNLDSFIRARASISKLPGSSITRRAYWWTTTCVLPTRTSTRLATFARLTSSRTPPRRWPELPSRMLYFSAARKRVSWSFRAVPIPILKSRT
jgi:hypothetical protein